MSKITKKKKAEIKKSPEMQFLASLGIKRVSPDAKNANIKTIKSDCAADLQGKSLDDLEWRNGEVNKYFFKSKEMATLMMSNSYDRLLINLETFSHLDGLLKNPKKIVELGSAAGIFSMYLAKLYPECEVIAYDLSPEPLEIGRQWANDLGIKNIRFEKESYEEIARRPPTKDCELVFLFDGLVLPEWSSVGGKYYLFKDAIGAGSPAYSKEVDNALNAFSNLLSPNGIGILSCYWDEWGVTAIMNALKKTDFRVDWDLSISRSRSDPDGSKTWESYLFLSKTYPEIDLTPLEKARAFKAASGYKNGIVIPFPDVVESYSTLFEGGTCLLRLEADIGLGITARIRVICKGGFLFLERTTTNEFHAGHIHTLSGIAMLFHFIRIELDNWARNDWAILECEIHGSFKELLKYYGFELT